MLDVKDIVAINKEVTGEGILLNEGMLHSALSSYHYYTNIELQICSIVRGLIKNHCFKDGNKRTAVVVFLALCEEFSLTPVNDDKLFKNIVHIAENNLIVENIAAILIV